MILCSVDGCDREAKCKSLCTKHYQRQWRNGHLNSLRGEQGEGTIDKDGYKAICVNGKRMREHRWLMEQHLGRRLYDHENIHHINGDRLDNRIENLELWSTQQPNGQRVVDKIKFCIDFLAQYGYEIK